MKSYRKYLLIIALIACAFGARAQEFDGVTVEETAVRYNVGDDYSLYKPTFDYKQTKEWKRYKTLRAVGWSALGVGIPGTLFGVVIALLEHSAEGGDSPIGASIIAVGGTMTVASIPILICAYGYRDKAKDMELRMSAITTPKVGGGMAYNYAPALSVAITF